MLWRYSVCYDGAPIGNRIQGIKWSRDVIKVKVVTPIHLILDISKYFGDRVSLSMEHQ